MHRLLLRVVAFCCAMSLSLFARAQQPAPPPAPPYGPQISIELAKKAAAAAVAEAKTLPYPSSFAIVGPAGNLVYFETMDNAPYASGDIAIAKAHTAAIFKLPTKVWFDRMESGHTFVMTLRPGMVAAAGEFRSSSTTRLWAQSASAAPHRATWTIVLPKPVWLASSEVYSA